MRMTWIAVAVLAGIAACPNEAIALGPERPVRPESRVWITGASNLRRFTCRARSVTGERHALDRIRCSLLGSDDHAAHASAGDDHGPRP